MSASPYLRWLHLSDLHFGHGEAPHRFNQAAVMRAILHDAKAQADAHGPPHYIFVTGDIAFSANPEEYAQAGVFLERLQEAVGIGPDRILMVPGNHDVCRKQATVRLSRKRLHEDLRRNPTILDEYVQEAQREDLKDPSALEESIWPKLQAYATFGQTYGSPTLSPAKPWWTRDLLAAPAPIIAVGLNTCLLSYDNEDGPKNLALGEGQLEQAIDAMDRRALLLVLMHHPPEWLVDGAELEKYLNLRPHIVFSGHVHTSKGLFGSTLTGGGIGHLAAGAGHGEANEKGHHAYAWGQLDPEGFRYWPRVHVDDVKAFKAGPLKYDLSAEGSHLLEKAGLPPNLKIWFGAAAKDGAPDPTGHPGRRTPGPNPPNLTPLLIQAQRKRHTPRKLPGAAEAVDLNHGYVRLTLWQDREACSLPLYLGQKRAIHAGDRKVLSELAEIPRAGIEKVLEVSPRTVILGDPGCGKTTLLLHLLHRSEGWRLDGADGPHLPVYVPLRTLDPAADLVPQIAAHLARLSGEATAKVQAHLQETMAAGRLLLLLDGLDEVDVEKRETLSEAIDGLLGRLNPDGAQNRALVTCRVLPYVEPYRLKSPDAVYQVAPLTGEDVPAFVQGFYGRHRDGHTLAQSLLTRLRLQHSRVNTMTQTPLLLGMLCLYFEEEQDLPERRVALYGRIVERLLLDEKPERGELEFYQEDKLQVLKELAWQAFRADAPLRRREVEKTILEHGDVGRDRKQARAFLAELKERSGLLCDLNPGQDYTFLHLTFEEYFVALYLAEGKRWREALKEHVGDERWAEVWRLLAGQLGEAGELLEAMVEGGASAELVEATSRDAGSVSVNALRALREQDRKVRRSDRLTFPNTALGAALIGQVQHRPRGLRHALDQLASTGPEGEARWGALRRLYLETLEADDALFRSEGRRLDPGMMYGVIAHLKHAVRNQRPGVKEIEDALKRWRAQMLPRLAFVEAPEGTFPMGSLEGTEGANDNESPLRQVRLDAFRLGTYPVTNAEFEVYDPSHRQERQFADKVKDPDELDRHPVVDVSWYEAWLFAEWVGGSLPTEAQWEYGARGPDGADRRGREYPWGDGEPSERLANFAPDFEPDVGHTTPVGAYPDGASWCGALDMAGNVDEWCADWLGPYEPTQTDDPRGPLDGALRVVRGGSWLLSSVWLRGAYRSWFLPGYRYNIVGFRLAAPRSLP